MADTVSALLFFSSSRRRHTRFGCDWSSDVCSSDLSLAASSGSVFALSDHDRILLIVPMFHANAWGLPYAGWLVGADFLMPGRFLQAEPLCRRSEERRVGKECRSRWSPYH